MKQAITDLYNLLKNNAKLNVDNATSIKVNTFCKYEDPLIPEFPCISLKRLSKNKQVRTMPLGYIETFVIEIIAEVQNMETDNVNVTSSGFDDLDKMTGIIENIIQETPKINGTYLNSDIQDTAYEAYNNDNYINYKAVITVQLQRKVIYQ
jgi:hypothetical protein